MNSTDVVENDEVLSGVDVTHLLGKSSDEAFLIAAAGFLIACRTHKRLRGQFAPISTLVDVVLAKAVFRKELDRLMADCGVEPFGSEPVGQ